MELNEKFREYLDEKSTEFLYLLKPITERQVKNSKKVKTSISHIPVTVIDSKDILKLETSRIDFAGNVTCRSFSYNMQNIGFDENDFLNLRKFVEKIYIRKEICEQVSYKFILNSIFNWCKLNYIGEINNKENFSKYLITEISKNVKLTKISAVIENLAIEKPFNIGDVDYNFFTIEFFNNWSNSSKNPEQIEKLRKKYQGKVIATVNVKAEPIKCIEIAEEKIENSLILLRVFSPTIIFDYRIPSYFGREGSVLLPTQNYFIFHNEFPITSSGINCKTNPTRTLDDTELNILKPYGLNIAIDLMMKKDLSKLEKKILKSLEILSRSVIFDNFSEKLLFTLTSIETILLKDYNEPIQSCIGRRLAFLSSKDPAKRKEINNQIIEAYKLRSKFVHHGELINESEILNITRGYVFEAICKILRIKDKVITHEKLIEKINDLTWT